MTYGTFQIPLWRVWQPATKSYVAGIVGSRRQVQVRLQDWLCNEFCDGYIPHQMDADDPCKSAYLYKYNANRRRFRIVQVQVRLADDFFSNTLGALNAVVLNS